MDQFCRCMHGSRAPISSHCWKCQLRSVRYPSIPPIDAFTLRIPQKIITLVRNCYQNITRHVPFTRTIILNDLILSIAVPLKYEASLEDLKKLPQFAPLYPVYRMRANKKCRKTSENDSETSIWVVCPFANISPITHSEIHISMMSKQQSMKPY